MKTKISLILPLVFGAALMLGRTDPASAGSKSYRSYDRSHSSSYPSSYYRQTPSRSYYSSLPTYYSTPQVVYIVYISSDSNCHSSQPVNYRYYSNDRGYRSHR
ncbi:MAG: hypothetical protein HZA50_10995 [Planctomycetes bacterium]|nr:hypothetical protein [Planctomycetota bacterium]